MNAPDPIPRLNAALEGRYRIERELGEGGMANVYLADDLKHERKVALKVLKPELAAVVGAERFLAEIKTTANLQHPHILPLFDSGEAEGFLFYVMPYVEGESLRARLDASGALPLEEALGYARDVASALTHAHGRGVVHRDIKPANVMISDEEALVADFGIAKALSSADDAKLTATGLFVGTPGYMGPEQIAGSSEVDGRSDVYALGCLLFEMLAGAPPFTGATLQAKLASALTEPPPSIRAAASDVPEEVDAAIKRALSKEPESRFATPRDFLAACSPARSFAEPRSKSRARPTAALAFFAVVVSAVYVGWRAVQVSDARASLAELQQLADAREFGRAFEGARAAQRWIPDEPEIEDLVRLVSDRVTIETEPPGAEVFVQAVPDGAEDTEPTSLGRTPVLDRRLPRGGHRVVVESEGFLTVERIVSTELTREFGPLADGADQASLRIVLEPEDHPNPETVAVPGGEYVLSSPDAPTGTSVQLEPFRIDRFEVTNEEFKTFVDDGGYADESLWTDTPPGIRGELVDRTGLPAPRLWSGRAFPTEAARHPVTGVSWYEARAYCRSLGKRLPTVFEWEKAARDGRRSRTGMVMPWGYQGAEGAAATRANFDSDGPQPVDAFPFGVSPYGAHGLAGNVREWIANALGDGRAATGGSWDGPSYLFTEYASLPPLAASPALGFRCALSQGSGDQGAHLIDLDTRTPTYTPVDATTFSTLLDHYRYDPLPPNVRNVEIETTAAWTRERLWIDAPAGDSVLLYFYTPTAATPPYQTIVFVPGSNAFSTSSLPDITELILGPSIQAGRAVLSVVLSGMVERQFDPGTAPPVPSSVAFRDLMVLHATELRRGMDYAETRGDVDPDRFAYVAVSFGAGSRLPFSAVDDRYQAVVYIGGGIDERVKPTLPEADNVNFAPYVRAPKLLLNGSADEEHPWFSRALPLWNLLTEPKELVLVEGAGHVPPPEARVPAINAFLDRVLGPVRR